MRNQKSKTKKSSDADRALAKPGKIVPGKSESKIPTEISLDTFLAEKDEVKNAEERMRQQRKNDREQKDNTDSHD